MALGAVRSPQHHNSPQRPDGFADVRHSWRKGDHLSLTCCRRSLEDLALDAMWTTKISLMPLLECFPNDVWNGDGYALRRYKRPTKRSTRETPLPSGGLGYLTSTTLLGEQRYHYRPFTGSLCCRFTDVFHPNFSALRTHLQIVSLSAPPLNAGVTHNGGWAISLSDLVGESAYQRLYRLHCLHFF